jgi:hypothetical protein
MDHLLPPPQKPTLKRESTSCASTEPTTLADAVILFLLNQGIPEDDLTEVLVALLSNILLSGVNPEILARLEGHHMEE